MDRYEAIIKAKKIQAMALNGATEGERNAARNRLDHFMKRHGLIEQDLVKRENPFRNPSAHRQPAEGVKVGDFTIPPEVIEELIQVARMFIFGRHR